MLNIFKQPYFKIKRSAFSGYPISYKFLYTIKFKRLFNTKKAENFPVDFYNTPMYVPLNKHYKPISKIVDLGAILENID